MKLIKRSFLLIAVLLSLTTCKKYPKDIPDWVKDKICYCKKKKNNCHKLVITEYGYNGEVYYRLDETEFSLPRNNSYFDVNQNLVCTDTYQIGNPSCSYFSNGTITLIRQIWQEN